MREGSSSLFKRSFFQQLARELRPFNSLIQINRFVFPQITIVLQFNTQNLLLSLFFSQSQLPSSNLLSLTNKIIYNMNRITKTSLTESTYILESNTQCASICCPASNEPILYNSSKLFKKDKKFINLTIGKQRAPTQSLSSALLFSNQSNQLSRTSPLQNSLQLFQEDKSTFLHRIRASTLNPQFERQQDSYKYPKQLDSAKQYSLTLKSNQNTNLSTFLQNLSSQYYSEMFVSSSIQGKIMLNGSLGSISEATSEMQLSKSAETVINHLQYTQEP